MQPTILVVDDEEVVRNLVCRILEAASYNVLQAGSGREAVALCESHAGPVHLAVLDVMMPGMTGPQLRDSLHQLLPSIRSLFISGYSYSYSYDQLARHGIGADKIEFLGKPFTIAELLGRVREMLTDTGIADGKRLLKSTNREE